MFPIPETSPSSPIRFPPHMCKTRRDAVATDPKPRRHHSSSSPRLPRSSDPIRYETSFPTDTGSYDYNAASTSSLSTSRAFTTSSSSASLASLRVSLSDSSTLYPFAEISASTNNFLSKRLSSSSSSWRCVLRGKDAVVFQRAFRGDPGALPARLAAICKSHHSSLVRLLGASLGGDHIYLVYEYAAGASLSECLRNPRNPNFTALSKWMSRIQVATDLAQGLEYIHCHSAVGGAHRGMIHNQIKSSSVIVTEPSFHAKICHFGAAELAGEVPAAVEEEPKEEIEEISEIANSPKASPKVMRRSDSRLLRIEGTRGYIAPEVLAGGSISKRSDVFAFGVVILELISGREPLKYTFDRESKDYERISLIETAREAIGPEDEDGASEVEAEERKGRVRRWVDRRLRDSFPVEVAERLIRVALRCVESEPWMRPDMTWVAGKASKFFLDSKVWEERVKVPTDFSVSLAPR